MAASPATYNNATFAKVDDYTFTLTFADAFPEQVLYAMAYGNFCPGPAHLLKPKHPKYGGESYETFLNAFPSDFMNFPTMGAWAVAEHRPDDIVVLRRNPYYWKVDETGQQLPYLDEMHYRLSTWGDRDVQAVAGTAPPHPRIATTVPRACGDSRRSLQTRSGSGLFARASKNGIAAPQPSEAHLSCPC